MWMTSGGVAEKIKKAKGIILNGLIGLLIIVFAYAMVSFVIGQLGKAIGTDGDGTGGCQPGFCCATGWRCSLNRKCEISDSTCSLPLDAFRIKKIMTAHDGLEQNYHQEVHLCSAIQPIFNSAIDKERIESLSSQGKLRIEESTTGQINGLWQVRSSNLIFRPAENWQSNTSYQSYFPKTIINTQSKMLQACLASGGCSETSLYFIWNFTTGTTLDDVSPEIIKTSPIKTGEPDYPDQDVSLNPVIEVYFSEAIDITTVADENNYPLPANVWLAELEGEQGEIRQTLPAENFKITGQEKGFKISLIDGFLLDSFKWYRVHVEGREM